MDEQTNKQPEGAAAAATVPIVPEPWEGGFNLYKHSKIAVKVNLGTLIITGVVYYLVLILLEIVFKSFGRLLADLLGIVASVAYIRIYLADIAETKITVEQAIQNSVGTYLNFLVLAIITAVAAVVSFLLLVVPFFFVFPRVSLASYYLIDKNMSVGDALSASWNAMHGHLTKFWGIVGATIAMALLMVTIIGIPFAIYFLIMYSASTAILYKYVSQNAPAPKAETAPAAN